MNLPSDSPLMQLRGQLAKPAYTVEKLLAMDMQKAADHYGIPLDWVKFERERALTERGAKPWELLKPEAPAQ